MDAVIGDDSPVHARFCIPVSSLLHDLSRVLSADINDSLEKWRKRVRL